MTVRKTIHLSLDAAAGNITHTLVRDYFLRGKEKYVGNKPLHYDKRHTPLTGSNQVFQMVSVLHSSGLLLVRAWPFK